ncbi:hypothetical protein [Humidesulfovibrio sp.]|uniref:hypothetical protein n=1 Tax=Humidesulfovibrio sp. TaxID=2910988 RepID=UPI002D81137D|nr:hypothetical protein [Humidesulfovibrio sp.]
MEVGWHLRFTREAELEVLVQAKLAPNVEDAVFIAGGWTLAWDRSAQGGELEGWLRALIVRKG